MLDCCGVILAAGIGSRIHPLSLHFPKPLLPVLNKAIIDYQIEYMSRLGIKEFHIVCGHLREKLEKHFGEVSSPDIRISYIVQDKPLGIAHALSKTEPFIQKPFMLFLGDIFFATKDLARMLELFEQRCASGVLAVKHEDNPEYIRRNFAVFLHQSGIVRRVIEKPQHSPSKLKGCGIYLFDLSFYDAVRRTPRTAMRDEYELTSSIQILLEDGYPVYPAEVVEWDMNITTIDDLLLCNQRMLSAQGGGSVIGAEASIPSGAVIESSVIGDGVIVSNPIKISNSVILTGSKVTSKKDLDNVLVFEDKVYHSEMMPKEC